MDTPPPTGSEDLAGTVARGKRVCGDDVLDAAYDGCDLVARGPGELDRIGHQGGDLLLGQAQSWVGREPPEQVVLRQALAHLQGHGDGVLLDGLVRFLASDAVADSGHQHLGGGQERQVAIELALHDGREDPELVEHGQEGLEQPVGSEEGVGQRHPSHDRAGDVALVPLVPGELADHRELATEHDREAVDALAGPGVHLVRHRRGPDLALPEPLGDQLQARHQPDRGGQVGRPGRELDQRGDDVEVERAWVDLTDAGEHPVEAEVPGHPFLEVGEGHSGPAEQVEHVLGGAHRALDAAQRVAREQVVEPVERDQHLVGDGGEPLAEGGRLSRHVVRPPRHHERRVLAREPRQPGQGRDHPRAQQHQRGADLQLLDVLGQVARGHPLVDVLVPRERAELLDPRLHVVPRHALTGRDAVQVDLVDHGLVVLDDARRERRRRAPSGRSAPRSRVVARARSCAPATRSRPGPHRRRRAGEPRPGGHCVRSRGRGRHCARGPRRGDRRARPTTSRSTARWSTAFAVRRSSAWTSSRWSPTPS